jgi:phage tail protein X
MQQLMEAGAQVVLPDLADTAAVVSAVLKADSVSLGAPVEPD